MHSNVTAVLERYSDLSLALGDHNCRPVSAASQQCIDSLLPSVKVFIPVADMHYFLVVRWAAVAAQLIAAIVLALWLMSLRTYK